MNKGLLISLVVMLLLGTGSGLGWGSSIYHRHRHHERYYQKIFCSALGGQVEYVLPDHTRVDCLLPDYAIEVDFAPKWAESVGQALYYARETHKRPGVLLILEDPERDMRYLRRLRILARQYGIKVWVILAPGQ